MSELKLTFLDVGHGSCTHIKTPNNTNILVDIGGSDEFSPAEYLAYTDRIGKLDALVLTHPHEDHYHDIINLERYGIKPRVLLRNKNGFPIDKSKFEVKDQSKVDYVNNLNISYNGEVPDNENPFKAYVNGGMNWLSFHADNCDLDKDDPNTFSGVYVLCFGGCKIVLTGDNNKEILAKMLKRTDFANAVKGADFLLAPHHGRTTDFCEEFFELVNPRATIISDKCCEHDSQMDSAILYNNKRVVLFNGDTRHVLTTRKDGNIVLRITDNGNFSFSNWYHRG